MKNLCRSQGQLLLLTILLIACESTQAEVCHGDCATRLGNAVCTLEETDAQLAAHAARRRRAQEELEQYYGQSQHQDKACKGKYSNINFTLHYIPPQKIKIDRIEFEWVKLDSNGAEKAASLHEQGRPGTYYKGAWVWADGKKFYMDRMTRTMHVKCQTSSRDPACNRGQSRSSPLVSDCNKAFLRMENPEWTTRGLCQQNLNTLERFAGAGTFGVYSEYDKRKRRTFPGALGTNDKQKLAAYDCVSRLVSSVTAPQYPPELLRKWSGNTR
ncbi:MAG: hypothetical protein AABY86_15115, partial [Bdellovibrionota bacterium]